jgi:ribosomal RNA-processing protein 8
MATKLFQESDSWGDSSGNGEALTFSFKKHQRPKLTKSEKKARKEQKNSELAAIADDPTAGRFVRAPQLIEQEDSTAVPQESPAKSKKNKRKRKRDEEVEENGNGPEKKLKEQAAAVVENEVKEPVTYGDKLRESLKGSRFRFLNEQMYKQKGEESMEIFKEDPTAFDAYHEGYRHQIAQWPMNPLDRIIKNIKRL